MKNTIIIDAKNSCACDLVSIVDDGTNRLFLEIHADVSKNPILEINGLDVEIDKNVFLYEIDSSYWVGTGALRFRIVDDAHVWDYFNITKISSLSGNVTLKQVDNFNYELCVSQTEADKIWGLIKDNVLDSVKNNAWDAIRDELYPVGSIYMSVNNVNPSNIYGGTWVAWGSGRVPVGVMSSDSNFSTVEQKGGASTVTLKVSQIPYHQHGYNSYQNGYPTNYTDKENYKTPVVNKNASYNGTGVEYTQCNYTGGNDSHNNLQPYITCYMWKRTA